MTANAKSAVVFVGPTLRPEDLHGIPEIMPLPPASQGDVYRIGRTHPRAIGLIDGYFDSVPAVCHKEILWAMAEGIRVFGSASMGALRAAELVAFGMVGVGRIFENFRDGTAQDDDDVAVVHGPADIGFLPLSEPMVNIQATLMQAVTAGIISERSRERFESLAKATFYQERTWSNLLAKAAAAGLPSRALASLQFWLVTGRVDQKREDALAMLRAMQDFLATSPGPNRVDFHFEWTDMWDDLVRSTAPTGVGLDSSQPGLSVNAILDELRLEGPAYCIVRRQALARLLGLLECDRRDLAADPKDVAALRDRWRRRLGLFRRAQLDEWCAANGVEITDLEHLIIEETRLEALAAAVGPALDLQMLSALRLSGDYARLATRAREKAAMLNAAGQGDDAADVDGPPPAALLPWYFERRLGRSVPDSIVAYAHDVGFADLTEFHRAVRKEWLYYQQGQLRDGA